MIRMLLAIALAGFSAGAFATKTCPPSPCTPKGAFDAKACAAHADWVAVGRVANLHHNPQGDPFFKDFANFDFTATRYEKGVGPTDAIHFEVGWCDNQIGPPDDTGDYRIYGQTLPIDPAQPNRYLFLERVTQRSTP